MTGPYLVAAISVSTIIALVAIATTSSNQMNYSLSAQQAMQLENTKNQENLWITIQNNILDVRNNALNPAKILEFRSIDKNTNMTNKIGYSASPLVISNIDKQFTPVDFTETTFSGKKVMAITELGNVFTAVNLDDLSAIGTGKGTGNGNGTAMINGMGLNSRIIQLDYFGKILHGQGISGIQDSLKPYMPVSPSSNYAAELLNSDLKITIPIPQFNAVYQYNSGILQLTGTTTPNILGYSQSRTVAGSGISIQTSDGIIFSGTGQIIVKLNDFGNQTLRLDGTVPSGAKLRLVEKPSTGTYDLMTIPYDSTYGFNVRNGTIYMYSSVYGGHCGVSCGWGQVIYGTYYMSGNGLPIEVSSLNNFAARASGITMTSSGTQNTNSYTVTAVNHQQSWYYYTQIDPRSPDLPVPTDGALVYYYDKSPTIDLLTFTTNFVGNTQQISARKQYYLIAEPNGDTITVSGVTYNPNTPYLKITNLPSNIPYEIVKDSYVSVSGMALASGPLTLLLNDVDIKGTQGAAPTGILYLYPNSLAYRGSFSTIVFDNINSQTIHIPTADDKIYVVHTYVQIPVTGSITITNTNLSGGTLGTSLGELSLSYLNGNYNSGDLIKVPVIPGYLNINMNINEVLTTTVISNVLGGTGIKIASPVTQTINDSDTDSIIPFIESTTGTIAYTISTATGNINANVLATISGSASLTNTVTLTVSPPPPPPPVRKDPLTGWIDIYKNGVLVQSVQLFFNDQPTFSSSNTVSGSSQIQTTSYSYTQTTISGTTVTSVTPGDMIEYYIYAKVHADGIPLAPPSGYIVSTVTSQGTATATIHSGSVNTSN